MVLVWFAHRKKPRIYRNPQEAWTDLLLLGREGFHGVGLPVRIQAWASEMDMDTFARSGEFFPLDFVESIYRNWQSGYREPMLALVRGLLMYVVLKPRWERLAILVAGTMVREGSQPQMGMAFVRNAEDGSLVAVATFYGRYPIFTLQEGISQRYEDLIRALGLRRMDSFRRARFQGYIRWIPVEYPPEEEAEEVDVSKWAPVPTPAGMVEGKISLKT